MQGWVVGGMKILYNQFVVVIHVWVGSGGMDALIRMRGSRGWNAMVFDDYTLFFMPPLYIIFRLSLTQSFLLLFK